MIFYTAIDETGRTVIKSTQADIKAVSKDFVELDVPTSKPELMAWIQQMLDETINAQPAAPVEQPKPEPVREEAPTARSIRFEDAWESFPLSLKFHFAAKAMEDGREILGAIAAKQGKTND